VEPQPNDEIVQTEETPETAQPDAGVVTGPAPYDVVDDDDWED
jgi:hypothetical protein